MPVEEFADAGNIGSILSGNSTRFNGWADETFSDVAICGNDVFPRSFKLIYRQLLIAFEDLVCMAE